MNTSPTISAAILKAIPDLIFLFDGSGTFLEYHANDPKELLMPPEVFIGKTLKDVMPPDQSGAMTELVKRAVADGGVHRLQYNLVIEGLTMNFEVRFTKVGPDRALGIVRNVTDLRETEEDLRLKTEELEKIIHAMVGREQEMVKLKEKVAELKLLCGNGKAG